MNRRENGEIFLGQGTNLRWNPSTTFREVNQSAQKPYQDDSSTADPNGIQNQPFASKTKIGDWLDPVKE